MAAKSAYQMTYTGRPGAGRWTVNKDGKFSYSSPRRSLAVGYLRLMRRLERQGKSGEEVRAKLLKLTDLPPDDLAS